MIERLKSSHILKQILIGAGIGALGGFMYGEMKWVLAMAILGGVLGALADGIDRLFYRPVEKGGSPLVSMVTVAIAVGIVTVLALGAFIWPAI